ncbi:hypothetical protein Bca52824_010390 [Brassica carinata]|uniref:F-box associated beta-propeller type 3 domain-containing protein n=1 Tax=Brassica carinata TaxID=52824 RepID=A0A8X7WE60_BRACI|nr:hypothetical protein Bca52824_010390 [Brassica carinata]
MNSRRRNVSDDPQTTRRRSSRLSSDELLLSIPIDLVIEIFSRLPLKSIRWASVLRRSDLTELFLTKSLAHPQLLFVRRKESKVIFCSSSQPQNLVENLSPIAVDHHIAFPFERVYDISSSVNGYVSISDYRMLKRRKTPEFVGVICNPSTRQCFTLPKMKTKKKTAVRSFLGYDPIEKQHKVLAMIWQKDGAEMHQVLTLKGNGNMTWRFIECRIQHSFPGRECICINGVLYYNAKVSKGDNMILYFDVRSEKYIYVKFMERGMFHATLINFQGKLVSLMILEDPEKHEWSKHIFILPPTWKDLVGEKILYFVGVTATNEFVFSPSSSSDLYYVYYYNFDKETITRVQIQGIGAFERDKGSRALTFLDHVEHLKLM